MQPGDIVTHTRYPKTKFKVIEVTDDYVALQGLTGRYLGKRYYGRVEELSYG